jgi:hypothetical protein
MPATSPRVHLVGSVPLPDAESVFRAVSDSIGPEVSRIPDGETGSRSNWIRWQADVFQNSPDFTLSTASAGGYSPRALFAVRPGTDPANVSFGPLGYSAAARASFQVFRALADDGVIAPGTRFQVSLPTPVAVTTSFVVPEDQVAVEPSYRAALLAELGDIASYLPDHSLAVQWDVAIEFALLERAGITWWGSADRTPGELVQRLADLGNAVPAGAQLGYHLCYGDSGHKHFIEPADTGHLVAVANGIADRLTRPLDFLHMPVPRERADPAYFAPLAGLSIPAGTELFLGLVHMTDGLPGALRRVSAARSARTGFGIATECGFGRRPPHTVPDLLALHRSVLAAYDPL